MDKNGGPKWVKAKSGNGRTKLKGGNGRKDKKKINKLTEKKLTKNFKKRPV